MTRKQRGEVQHPSQQRAAGTVLGRRGLLQAMAAGVTLASAGCGEESPAGKPETRRIDTHHHAIPPALRAWMVEQGALPPNGGPPWANWSLATTLEMMDANGIEVGVLSSPAPSHLFKDMKWATEGVRVMNDSLAQVVRENPTRFGMFAYLPLAHVDVAMDAAAYALDELGADGVLMMNQVENRYLGDPVFEPLFDLLNRRRAVIMTHPDNLPGGTSPRIPPDMGDFLLDTTRNAVDLILSGTLERYPDVSIILSHCGGFLPYMAGRLVAGRYDGGDGLEPEAIRPYLQRFYYDTALPMSPYATPSLLATVDPSRILYGSDWNALSAEVVASARVALDDDPAVDAAAHVAISRDNALRMLPRLAQRLGAVPS